MSGRKPLRYSLAALLFVLILFAVVFAAYRTGLEQGYVRGYAGGEKEWSLKHPYFETHCVAELVRAPQGGHADGNDSDRAAGSIGLVMAALQSNVARDHWESVGGPYSMTPTRDSQSVRIYATRDIHDQIDALLSDSDAARKAMRDLKHAQQEMRAAQEAAADRYLTEFLAPVEETLNQQLSPIPAEMDLHGTWDVSMLGNDSRTPTRFEFLPPPTNARGGSSHTFGGFGRGSGGTVKIRTVNEQVVEIEKEQYSAGKGNLTIAQTSYVAATDDAGRLVLVDRRDPSRVLIATQQ